MNKSEAISKFFEDEHKHGREKAAEILFDEARAEGRLEVLGKSSTYEIGKEAGRQSALADKDAEISKLKAKVAELEGVIYQMENGTP